jgi:hypothetical protein
MQKPITALCTEIPQYGSECMVPEKTKVTIIKGWKAGKSQCLDEMKWNV